MNVRFRNIIIILVASLLFAFIGAYVGAKLFQTKQASNNLVSQVAQSSDITVDLYTVAKAYEQLHQHYIEVDEEEVLLEVAIHGMIDVLDDTYSSYMDLESMEDFQEQIEASFEGIGAEVSMVDGKVTIVAPIKNSPAEEVGLRP